MGRSTWGLLVVLGIAVGVCLPEAAEALPGLADQEPAAVLVMPFDLTAGHASFMNVSRTHVTRGALQGRALNTSWVFYSAACDHLVDMVIWLTDNDTVVVDAAHIQSQRQIPGMSVNVPQGPVLDLSGSRGFVIVTAIVPIGESPAQLIGSWTIADVTAGSSFGSDAVGFTGFRLPDPAVLNEGGLSIPTFDPATLDTSTVIVVGLEEHGGSIVPIDRPSELLAGSNVCCQVALTDTLGSVASAPDVCFGCALFAPVATTRHPSADPPILPVGGTLGSAGMIRLRNCRSLGQDGRRAPLGEGGFPQFLVGFHGQAVGPFGVATSGKYDAGR